MDSPAELPDDRFGTDEDLKRAHGYVDDVYYSFLLARHEVEGRLKGKLSPAFIAQKTGIPATTIQGWLKGAVPQPRKEKPRASRKRKAK